MPIYDQGYQTYESSRLGQGRRWIPLWREEVMPFLKKRVFIFLLFLAIIPWLYGVALTFLHTQVGNAEWAADLIRQLPKVDEKLVASLLTNGWSNFLMVIVTVWVGSGLVARDRKERTLEVYLGRAIGAVQYLWAKGAALLAFLLLFNLLPTAVLVSFHVGLSGDAAFLWDHSRALWGTLLYTIAGTGSLTLFVLALSSLSRSPRLVGVAYIGLSFFGSAGGGILYAITKHPAVTLCNYGLQLELLGFRCLGVAPDSDVPFGYTLAFFSLLTLASLGVLVARFSRRGVLR